MIKRNLTANFSFRICNVTISLLALPLYLHILGPEAYGVIGFYAAISAAISILDFGLTVTTTREVARLCCISDSRLLLANLCRTFEIVYWITGSFLILLIGSLAPLVVSGWLNVQSLNPTSVCQSVVSMGCTIGLLWPFNFYSGALIGLEKQIPLNLIQLAISILKNGGSLVILYWLSPTIEAFFMWQAACSLIQTLLTRDLLNRYISLKIGRFKWDILIGVQRFTIQTSGLAILTLLLANIDKIILSKTLSLTNFGYYSLASTGATIVNQICVPVFSTFLPRYTNELVSNNQQALKKSYHMASQILAIFIFPLAALVFFFPDKILAVWGFDTPTIEAVFPLLKILIVGSTIASLLTNLTTLQIASGSLRLAIFQNGLGSFILGASLYHLIPTFGAIAGAYCWSAINLIFLLIIPVLMHRFLLKPELRKWYVEDITIPFIVTLGWTSSISQIFPANTGRVPTFFLLVIIFMLAILLCFLTSPQSRIKIGALFQSAREKLKSKQL
jgi:O-antigen/teichoic acid export membrane protein